MSATATAGSLTAALARIAEEREGAICALARMIATDTSFPPGEGYARFADLIELELAPLGFSFRRVVVPRALWSGTTGQTGGERVNLIAARPAGRPVCSLYFHVDTVPSGPGWTHPPLALTRNAGRLYGRGSADMKGAIAAALLALRAVKKSMTPLAYDPQLLFCTDEEGGLYPGIRHLAEQGSIAGHLLSCNGRAAPRIWAGCFGSFDLLIRAYGTGGHSGESTESRNAVELSVPLLERLLQLKRTVETRTSAMPPRGKQPLTARLTIAAAHGGDKGSAVPPCFEILVNRRYAPEEDFNGARREIETAVEDEATRSGLAVRNVLLGHLAPVSNPQGPHWPRWQAALARGFGWPADAFRTWGATSSSDMGWVQRTGTREILLGGLGRPDNNVHAADEFTTIEDLEALACSILLYLAHDFAPELLPET